jgi:hypothetical protein
MGIPKLTLGLRAVLHDLEEFVAQRRELLPKARVATKENARGDVVLAIIVPSNVGLPDSDRPPKGDRH